MAQGEVKNTNFTKEAVNEAFSSSLVGREVVEQSEDESTGDGTLFDIQGEEESSSDSDIDDAPGIEENIEEWKQRKEMQRKANVLHKVEQCGTRIMLLEKERNGQIFAKRSEFRQQYIELEDTELKLISERGIEKKRLKEQLQKIANCVQRFQREVKNAKPSHASIEKVKRLMEEVEENIVKFKDREGSVYEDMIKREKILYSDLESFSNKIQYWTARQADDGDPNVMRRKASKNDEKMSVPPEVKEFERFMVQTGGHQGGWDDVDHQTFLKLRRQHRDDHSFLNVAETALPVRTREDILEHIEWYKEYCILRDRKRKAIQIWKSMKDSEKQEILSKADENVVAQQERDSKHKELIEKEKQERFQKLEDWKNQRLKEQAEKEEREKEKRMKEEEKRREDLRKQAEVKAMVQDYVSRKKEEDQILKEIAQRRELEERMARRPSKQEIERIRERDKKIIEEKQERMKRKEDEQEEKEKRLSKLKNQVKVTADRDPNRLHRLTKGWQHRKDADRESTASAGFRLPHRAVPSWRQGLP